MSLDNTIRAISYSEAPTLGVAIAMIAKHRMDVDAAMRAAELQPVPVISTGAAEERAVEKIATAAEVTHLLDKVA